MHISLCRYICTYINIISHNLISTYNVTYMCIFKVQPYKENYRWLRRAESITGGLLQGKAQQLIVQCQTFSLEKKSCFSRSVYLVWKHSTDWASSRTFQQWNTLITRLTWPKEVALVAVRGLEAEEFQFEQHSSYQSLEAVSESYHDEDFERHEIQVRPFALPSNDFTLNGVLWISEESTWSNIEISWGILDAVWISTFHWDYKTKACSGVMYLFVKQ